MDVTISEVTFEHHRSALGIAESTPRLSWRFSGNAKRWIQRRYEIAIAMADEPERTYVEESSDSVFVHWPARPLASREGAVVRVRAFGPDDRPTPWSSEYSVEVGLLRMDDWECSLIEASQYSVTDAPKQPLLFRRNFTVLKKVAKARLYSTAHGVYEATINGQRVGDHVLDPGWSSYHHRLAYQTFDVTDHLKAGANCIGVVVGEGWWAGRLGIHGGCRNIWGAKIGLIAQVVINFQDGSTEHIVTDHAWTTSTGGLLASEIYNGETYDARKEPLGWATAEFNDENWTAVTASPLLSVAARLVPPDAPPIRCTQEVHPTSIFKSPSGKTLVDFGQNLVGCLRVSVLGPAGHTVAFQHAEVLEHGEAGTRPLWGAAARDMLILGSGREVWQPKFTYHGFRYVEVIGWPSNDGVPGTQDITAIVFHTGMERTGYFECSEPLLNKLHQNVVWSMRGNFLSLPTDCPQRGERLGWTGDIQAFGPTATYLYRSAGLLKGWLKDLAFEQHEDGGAVPPLVVPDVLSANPVFKTRARKAQAIWGDVAVSLPWDIYSATGDDGILSQQYHSMQSWMDRGVPRKANGLWNTSNHPQLADWLDPSAPPDDPGNGLTDGELVANAFLVGMTDLMARTSTVLGKLPEAARYATVATALREEFQSEYVTPRGRIVCDTQTALALAIRFSLFASAAQAQHAGARLAEIVRSRSRFKIATGFAGTPAVGHALAMAGQTQVFYRMLLHRRCPSWLYPVIMGATTVWERWDSMLPDGSINPGAMTSFNHYALGAVAHWMHTVAGGLRADTPGWRRVHIAPVPGGTLTSASASLNGPYGLVSSAWRIEGDDEFVLEIAVPPNTSALVQLPCDTARKEVGSGRYTFRCQYTRPEWPPKPSYGAFYRNVGEDDDI